MFSRLNQPLLPISTSNFISFFIENIEAIKREFIHSFTTKVSNHILCLTTLLQCITVMFLVSSLVGQWILSLFAYRRIVLCNYPLSCINVSVQSHSQQSINTLVYPAFKNITKQQQQNFPLSCKPLQLLSYLCVHLQQNL